MDSFISFKRLQYAIVLTVLCAGVLTVIDMIFRLGLGEFVYSHQFAGIAFGISYLVAPFAMKKIKLD